MVFSTIVMPVPADNLSCFPSKAVSAFNLKLIGCLSLKLYFEPLHYSLLNHHE
jgi:hypothetical protein